MSNENRETARYISKQAARELRELRSTILYARATDISRSQRRMLAKKAKTTGVFICPICRSTIQDIVADHDHANGRTRGLICRACNAGLGMFKDNASAMRRAALYVERHQVASELLALDDRRDDICDLTIGSSLQWAARNVDHTPVPLAAEQRAVEPQPQSHRLRNLEVVPEVGVSPDAWRRICAAIEKCPR